MDVRMQAIHFEISDKLVEFINKKTDKLARRCPDIATVDVTLKVVKPETAMNKEAVVKITTPQYGEAVATKIADSFEEAYDLAIEALERQLQKSKDKK